MPEPAPTRRESSKAVPVGEPPTPEGWTKVGDQLQSAASRMAAWVLDMAKLEDRTKPNSALLSVPYEVHMAAAEAGSAVDEWTELRRVAPVGGTGVRGEEKTTVLDGYFATGDYECFVFDKHEGPGGHHGDECRVYPDDLVPEGSKRKRGRWTISIRFESVGEGDEP